jgi:hypothetical protein
MEQPAFNPEEYRDGLAQDLKELRLESRQDAQIYLDIASQTSRYNLAENEHVSKRKELLEGEQTMEREEVFKRAVEIVKHNPEIWFFVSGIGNVLNQPNARTNGAGLYVFDHTSQKMGAGTGIPGSIMDQPRGTDALYIPSARKDIIKNLLVYSVRFPFQGYEGNQFAEDNRKGVHMTVGIGIPKDSKPEELFGPWAKEVFQDESAYCELAMDYCAKELVPDFYNFVMSLAEKAKK